MRSRLRGWDTWLRYTGADTVGIPVGNGFVRINHTSVVATSDVGAPDCAEYARLAQTLIGDHKARSWPSPSFHAALLAEMLVGLLLDLSLSSRYISMPLRCAADPSRRHHAQQLQDPAVADLSRRRGPPPYSERDTHDPAGRQRIPEQALLVGRCASLCVWPLCSHLPMRPSVVLLTLSMLVAFLALARFMHLDSNEYPQLFLQSMSRKGHRKVAVLWRASHPWTSSSSKCAAACCSRWLCDERVHGPAARALCILGR